MVEERVRWESLNNLLRNHIPDNGYELLSLGFESTFELLERLTVCHSSDGALNELVRTFNDPAEQDNVIYHVRVCSINDALVLIYG